MSGLATSDGPGAKLSDPKGNISSEIDVLQNYILEEKPKVGLNYEHKLNKILCSRVYYQSNY